MAVAKCWYCERDIFERNSFALDRAVMSHKVPVSRGGRWLSHNTVACCNECHAYKGTSTAGEILNFLFSNYCKPRAFVHPELPPGWKPKRVKPVRFNK